MNKHGTIFSGWLKRIIVCCCLFALVGTVRVEPAVAQTEMTRIERIAEYMAERAAERAMRRAMRRAEIIAERKAAHKALRRAEIIAEKKAAHKAMKRAEQISLKKAEAVTRELKKTELRATYEQTLKERPAIIAERKARYLRRIALNRIHENQELYTDRGYDAIGDELLILAEKKANFTLENRGYQIKERKYLKGLDLVLIRVAPPKGKKLSESASEVIEIIGSEDVSLNHLFIPEASSVDTGDAAYSMTDISENLNLNSSHTGEITLGLIDTLVDRTHSALQNEVIQIEDFVPYDNDRPKRHGTAVASILVGNDPDTYKGVVPGARLFAASVFFEQDKGKTAATTESLILALD
ncbi:MAG: S8 family serine peptidase, partial [Emcibacter sp.]|nr:S8 family serine peptidase [Emcibacter sp.]